MASLLLGWPLVWLVFLLAEVEGLSLVPVVDIVVVVVVMVEVVVVWLVSASDVVVVVVVGPVSPVSPSLGGGWEGSGGVSSMIRSSWLSYLVQVCWTSWAHRRFFLWVLKVQDPPHR